MIYIIGGNGFVGSGLARFFLATGIEHRIITRENFENYRDTSCDILINANGNSKKFLANNEPLTDFDLSVRSVAVSLEAFHFKTYVMLSSGDVYPQQHSPDVTKEDVQPDPARQSRYGLHKNLAERLVQGCGRPWIILRMGGFVGPGLKKNAIFDMLTNAPVWLSPNSELQFISTDSAAKLIWALIELGNTHQVFNLGAIGTVLLSDIHRRINSHSTFRDDAPAVRYELSLDKLQSAIPSPLPHSLGEVQHFIDLVANGMIELNGKRAVPG